MGAWGRTRWFGVASALAVVLAAATASPALAAEADFGPQGDAPQSFTVPPGVFFITMTARGGGGEQGDSDTGRPGRGALVRSTFEVTPGEELRVYVATGDGWGYAEGGDRGEVGGTAADGAGGGGASAVLEGSTFSPFLIAGGGGGAGGDDGESDGGAGGDAGIPPRSGAPGMRGHDPVPEKVAGGCGGCESEGEGGKGDGEKLNLNSGGGGGGGGGGAQGGAGGEDGSIEVGGFQASGAGGGGGSSFIHSGGLDNSSSIYGGCEEREGPDCEGFVSLSWGGSGTRIAASAGNGQHVRATRPYGPLTAKVTDAEGVPVFDTPVTFRVPGRGAGGVLPGGGGTVVVDTNGQGLATLNGLVANAAAGPWALEASIPGDSQAALFTLENEAIGTTTAVVSSLDPATALESPELTATVAADAAESTLPPGGEVGFTVDGTPIVPAVPLAADGTARLAAGRVPFLGAGEHTVTARYLGDPAHTTSLATLKQTVTKEPTALGVEIDPNPAASGEGVDLTARIATVGALSRMPTGEVTFELEGASLSAPLNGEGVAVVHTTAKTFGSNQVVATYAGDEAFAATSGEAFESVGEAATATVLATSANPAVFGAGTTVRASVVRRGGGSAPVGSVGFTVDGQTTCAAVALVAASAGCALPADLGAGTHAVVATYEPGSGSADAPSIGALRQVVVGAPTATALGVTPVPSLFGEATALRATVARADGAPASGSVAFVLDGVELATVPLAGGVATLAAPCAGAPPLLQCPLAAGAHLAEALFLPAGAGLRPSRASAFAHVDDDPTTTTVSAVGAGAGEPVTFTAEVSSGSGRPPRGAVQFLVDGVALGEPAVVVRGVATSTAVAPAAGLHRIVGHFIGAGEFADSEGAAEATTRTAPPASPPPPSGAAPVLQLESHKDRVDAHGNLAPRVSCVGAPGQVCAGTVRLLAIDTSPPKASRSQGRQAARPTVGTELAAGAVAIPAGTTAAVPLHLSKVAGRTISADRTLAAGVDLATGSSGPVLRLRATLAPRLTPLSAAVLGGKVAVRVRCPRGAEACRGELRIFAGRQVGRAGVKVAAGTTRRILVPTPRRGGGKVLVQARTTLPVGHPSVVARRFEVGR
jgi:hypothetical protein